jgi:hypothetical protein
MGAKNLSSHQGRLCFPAGRFFGPIRMGPQNDNTVTVDCTNVKWILYKGAKQMRTCFAIAQHVAMCATRVTLAGSSTKDPGRIRDGHGMDVLLANACRV